jgi:hypothetical protein
MAYDRRMIGGTPSLAASIGGDRRQWSKIVAGDNDTRPMTVEVIIKKISRLLGYILFWIN